MNTKEMKLMILPSAKLLTQTHEKHTIQNSVYKRSSWWWTRDVRNL